MRPRLVRARPSHRLGAAILATAVAVTAGISPAAVRTALAAGPLRIEADATYVLDPGDGRVHVAIDFELTNLKPNSSTTIFYYSTYLTAIHPDAVGLSVTDASGALSTTTKERRFFTRLEVHLRNFLYYNQSTRFTVRYDLEGGAPRSNSWVRVSKAFATFGVWAWGDPGRSTVKVRMPAGFETTVDGDDLQIDSDGSGEILTAEPGRPDTFYAILSAENRDAYTSTRISLPGDIELVLLAWPEDQRWEETATDTLTAGLPELVDLIGLPWPVNHDLEVLERFTPALEGYAGVFFTLDERIELSEDLDPLTTMHEASHAWFNDSLFAERWIYEGLAEEYAWRVQKRVGGSAGFGPLEPDADDKGHVALDSWTFPQVIRDQETDDRERYGYQASFWVIHTIVEAAGLEHMEQAYASAHDNRTAYVGAPGPEMVAVVDDWHRFLDLAQPIDQPDSAEVDAAVEELVISPGNSALLDLRHDARERYRELVAAGQGWLPPWLVRRPMGTWTFAEAQTAMDGATAVLQQRDQIQAAAAALGLTPDDTLKTAYETAAVTYTLATAAAADQLEALTAIADAKARLDAPVDLVGQIGLLGATAPASSYDASRAAFERGELEAAVTAAAAVTTLLADASALGQQRLIIGAVVAGVLLLLFMFILVRRRRGRRATPALATAAAVPAIDAPPAVGAETVAAGTAVASEPAAEPRAEPGVAAEPEDAPPPSSLAWPREDFQRGAESPPPERAWWLPTRESPDPAEAEPSDTLATDPASPSPPPTANSPDVEGDASPGEPPSAR
jgi:hypothetical protein